MDTREFFEASYLNFGMAAQRRYPNEEFLRFMGRNFFGLEQRERSSVRVLEVGCGSGANLWVIAKEGFEAHGLDISIESLSLAKDLLGGHLVEAKLEAGDMTDMPYPDNYFDGIVDVFSSYCMNEDAGERFLSSVKRVLKPGGIFFSYFPSKDSDAFKDFQPASFLDASTLDGVHRKTSPYSGNHYPFRFMSPEQYRDDLDKVGLSVVYLETTNRTYIDRTEKFEFISVEAIKSIQ
jgi:SAM-dependent methyltransferase